MTIVNDGTKFQARNTITANDPTSAHRNRLKEHEPTTVTSGRIFKQAEGSFSSTCFGLFTNIAHFPAVFWPEAEAEIVVPQGPNGSETSDPA